MTARTTHRGMTFGALLLAVFLAAMEATVTATAMPTIIADLGGLLHYGWIGASYLLASTITIPLFGKMADLYGRKPVMLAGLALFLVGCTLCAAANSLSMLIAGRFIQGVGAGSITPVSLTIVGDLYSVRERGRIQAIIGTIWGVAGVAGPLLGGLLVSTISWRSVFWINLPFVIGSAIVLMKALHEQPVRHREIRIDWTGALLLTAASLMLLLAAEGNHTAVLLMGGAVLTGIFILAERRAHDPVIPMGLLARRDIATACASAACVGVVLMGVIHYLPLYMQGVTGRTPTQAGMALTPLLVGWPLAATACGHMLARSGPRAPAFVGAVCIAGACVVIAQWVTSGGPYLMLASAMFLCGIGLGLCITALLIATQVLVPYNQRGIATATNMFFRLMGGAMGVGALGALLSTRLTARMPAEQIHTLINATPGREALPPSPAALAALSSAIGPLFWVMAAAAGINVVAVWLYPKGLSLINPPGAPVPATPLPEALEIS